MICETLLCNVITDFGFGPNDDHKANKTFHLYATTFFYCVKCFIVNYLSSLKIINSEKEDLLSPFPR